MASLDGEGVAHWCSSVKAYSCRPHRRIPGVPVPVPMIGRSGRPIGSVCAEAVGDLLPRRASACRANAKILEGRQRPDRDARFRYIEEQAEYYQDTGGPVISVDTKKYNCRVRGGVDAHLVERAGRA